MCFSNWLTTFTKLSQKFGTALSLQVQHFKLCVLHCSATRFDEKYYIYFIMFLIVKEFSKSANSNEVNLSYCKKLDTTFFKTQCSVHDVIICEICIINYYYFFL